MLSFVCVDLVRDPTLNFSGESFVKLAALEANKKRQLAATWTTQNVPSGKSVPSQSARNVPTISVLLDESTQLPTVLIGLTKEYACKERLELHEFPLKLPSEPSVPISSYYEWQYGIDFLYLNTDDCECFYWFINCNVDSLFYGVVLEITDCDDERRFVSNIAEFEKQFLQKYNIKSVEHERALPQLAPLEDAGTKKRKSN